MSNVKEVRIEGSLPYNCYEHEKLMQMFGAFSLPDIGIEVVWTGEHYFEPSEHGGQTCFNKFIIRGAEAYRTEFFDDLMKALLEAGADLTDAIVQDIDGGQAWGYTVNGNRFCFDNIGKFNSLEPVRL